MLPTGTPATCAAGKKLAVAVGSTIAWLVDHLCPDRAIGEQFETASDDFADLAEQCAIAARTIGDHPGSCHHDLDGKAARATADLMVALSATSRDDE